MEKVTFLVFLTSIKKSHNAPPYVSSPLVTHFSWQWARACVIHPSVAGTAAPSLSYPTLPKFLKIIKFFKTFHGDFQTPEGVTLLLPVRVPYFGKGTLTTPKLAHIFSY